MPPIRVLVVDDSAVIRRLLAEIIASDAELEVAGTAANGRLALQKIAQLRPDVVTLDVEMPDMDGIATLREMRAQRIKLPVIMFSTLTERHARATLEALSLGAADYVTKPSNTGNIALAIERVRADLIPKIRAFGPRRTAHANFTTAGQARTRTASRLHGTAIDIVTIASSTGGPTALECVLAPLPAALPVPIVVVQHMPPVFTKILSDRLDAKCRLSVREARRGMVLEPGCAYIAPGDHHLVIARTSTGNGRCEITSDPPENSCRPAADVLFRSVAAAYGAAALGVVMTGMGQDGLRGSRDLVEAGADVIVQDEATSVVWGMPGFVARAGLASEILPLEQIGAAIDRRTRRAATATSGGA